MQNSTTASLYQRIRKFVQDTQSFKSAIEMK